MLQHANEGMDTFAVEYLQNIKIELGLKQVAPKVETDPLKIKTVVTQEDGEEVGCICKGKVCPVCQGLWEPDEETMQLRCNHFMHEEYMQQCRSANNKCPVCS